MGYFIHRYLFHRLCYIIEPSFICCQVHYSHTYVLILTMTHGLDCETYCVTVSHVIPLNVTAPLSYRYLILLLKEFSSMVFNFRAVQGIELQLSRESYRFIDFYIKPLSIGPHCLGNYLLPVDIFTVYSFSII